MIQKIIVVDFIQPALCKQESHMLLELPAVLERSLETVHDFFFFFAESIRIPGINSRKIRIKKLVFFSVQIDSPLFIINPVEQRPVLKVKRFLTPDDLPLQLKLNNRDCLMDPQIHLHFFRIHSVGSFQFKTGAGIIPVYAQGKCRQREQVNAVPVFKDIQIAVSRTDADHIGNASSLSGGGAHPYHIMISPLDIHGMV